MTESESQSGPSPESAQDPNTVLASINAGLGKLVVS